MREGKAKGRSILAVPLLVALICTPATLARTHASATAAVGGACERPSIGFLGPITGHAAFIGKEQLGFARYAVRRLGRRQVRLVEADTQLDPRKAAKVGARLHADPRILAVVGPASSREVLAVASVFERRRPLPFISGSALSASLTNGSIPNFFRVVPNDSVQSPTIAMHIRKVLKAKAVLVVDDRTAYSRRLADGVQAILRARGVPVTREFVSRSATDFTAIVARIPGQTDVVFLPWSVARNAQIFGNTMKEQGTRAVIVGADGLDSADFTIAGSYISAFAPDIRGIKGNTPFIRGYRDRFVSNFGPPVYVATQVAVAAIRRACGDGEATRAEVQRLLKQTRLPRTVLGRTLRFTARGDVRGSTFSIFRLGTGGKKTFVS